MSNDNKDNHSNEKHIYDNDIVELDNQLPRWWLMLFYATAIFAAIYYVHYELGAGQSIDEEFAAEMGAIDLKRLSAPAGTGLDEKKLVDGLTDPTRLARGKDVFAGKCVSCHGAAGGGGIGPNLTDSHWINGDGTPLAIAKVIKDGVPAKGMPPWGALLSEDELLAVSSYVKSLKGTNPKDAKAPQGVETKN